MAGGSNAMEGYVEVCHDGSWGVICDDDWEFDDAKVICRQIGYK